MALQKCQLELLPLLVPCAGVWLKPFRALQYRLSVVADLKVGQTLPGVKL